MIDVVLGSAFKLSVFMVSSSDASPVVGLASGVVKAYTKTEVQNSVHPYSLVGGNWRECGHGLYEVSFGANYSSGLGRFNTVVTGSSVLPAIKECQVVGAIGSSASASVVQTAVVYDAGILGIQFFLERDGSPVTNPVSGEFHLYNQVGTQVASGVTSVSDGHGSFRFSRSINLDPGTLPYGDCTIKDGSGRETSRIQLPVVR